MRRERFRIEIPDVEYYRKLINCQYACPVHTHSGGYVTAIAEGRFEEAYNLARAPNPFPYVCGRVCGHPCEDACRRGAIDQPIAIRALKRTATDHHDLGLGHDPAVALREPRKEKVAIIGAGPAGLSAAHDLARMGYRVTVFEATSVAGGMLYLGLPIYRLPRDVIRLEVDAILNLGVELRTNAAVGRDFTLDELREQGYKAIFIAVGAHKSRELNIEGAELDGVLRGVEFLLNVNLGYRVELGDKVLTIGGGNVAVDVARSVLRQTEEIDKMSKEELKAALDTARTALLQVSEPSVGGEEKLTLAVDAARSALRLGAKEVHMICLESREEMPAHDWEIEEATGEGVVIHTRLGPSRILGRDGQVVGLETVAVKSVFDEQGRFNPTFIEGTESVIDGDTVILAIGQASDLSFLRESDGIEVTPRGTIAVDPDSLATTAEGIFAGGDVAFGPRLIIDAIADGQKAARAIDEYVTGKKQPKKRMRMRLIKSYDRYEDYDRIARQKVPTIPTERRVGIAEVELGFPDEAAVLEGERCLKCAINTIFNGQKCILCGGCVDVCPEDCLRLVKLDEMEGDERLAALLEARYGALRSGERAISGTAMIKDEERCIRCGLCHERCPTGAITMEVFEFEEEEVYE
ncbi:MAG: FAD-dependent oxidoreductase [bacterium]